MQINEKTINEKAELIELIKTGINPLEYIQNDLDVDFISSAIISINVSEDSYFDDMADILLKSFIYYLKSAGNEVKTLGRCKELVDLGLNNDKETLQNMISSNESSKSLFTGINIASDETYNKIFETLNSKLSEILK